MILLDDVPIYQGRELTLVMRWAYNAFNSIVLVLVLTACHNVPPNMSSRPTSKLLLHVTDRLPSTRSRQGGDPRRSPREGSGKSG